MIVTRFYDTTLAQASYLIGCSRSGAGDRHRSESRHRTVRPRADAEGVRITHVTETHIHADYVSGVRELAARTGATLLPLRRRRRRLAVRLRGGGRRRLIRDGDRSGSATSASSGAHARPHARAR